MNRIPKCRSKYYIPQPNNIKPSQKEYNKENIPQNISKKTLKFVSSRHFGKDITNNNYQNIHSIYGNNNTKMVTIIEKKTSNNNTNNNIYIKKHSSASQVATKNKKTKNIIIEKKLRENKSGSVINKKNDPIISEYYYKNSNIKSQNPPTQPPSQGSKLHSSISFGFNGINGNMRPISNNNNTISVRLSNPKSNNIYKVSYNYNNRSSNNYNNNINSSSNNTNSDFTLTHTNTDLM